MTPGQQHEATMAEVLLEHAQGRACIADTGFDADRIIDIIRARSMKPVIPPHPTRKTKQNRRGNPRTQEPESL